MEIPTGAGLFWRSHRTRPTVHCASCGTTFDADGATTGDHVRCPLCAEVVQLDGVFAERRRYRARTPLVFGDPRQRPRRRRRAPPAAIGLYLLVIACAVLFVWWWVYPIHPK